MTEIQDITGAPQADGLLAVRTASAQTVQLVEAMCSAILEMKGYKWPDDCDDEEQAIARKNMRYALDAITPSLANHARDQALEEAASLAEDFTNNHPHGPAITADRYKRDIAASIRALSLDAGEGK